MFNSVNIVRAADNALVLDLRRPRHYAEKNIPKNADNVLISAAECLEAYNKGGLMIHFTKASQNSISEKSKNLVQNMMLFSDKDSSGGMHNIQKALLKFTSQKPVSSTFEIRKGRFGENVIERFVLEDGSIIDKELYNSCRHSLNEAFYDLDGAVPYKVNIDNLTMLFSKKDGHFSAFLM